MCAGFEEQVDDIADACDIVRQGGATGLFQQGRPVPIRDCQVVRRTSGVECSEL